MRTVAIDRRIGEQVTGHRLAIRAESTVRDKQWVDRRSRKRRTFTRGAYLVVEWATGEWA